MKVLVAEDNDVSRHLLVNALTKWGYDISAAATGTEAWEVLQGPEPPRLAILDWMMPGMTGVEVCQRARTLESVYIILLTERSQTEDIATGLESGADDYMTKPFTPLDLRARLRVGERIIGLQTHLASKIRNLSPEQENTQHEPPLVSICSYCKKIRDETNSWQKLESYVSALIDGRVTHGICPDCYDKAIQTWQEQQRPRD